MNLAEFKSSYQAVNTNEKIENAVEIEQGKNYRQYLATVVGNLAF